jgi:hypothetical protein
VLLFLSHFSPSLFLFVPLPRKFTYWPTNSHREEGRRRSRRKATLHWLPREHMVKIVDFGNACWIDRHFTGTSLAIVPVPAPVGPAPVALSLSLSACAAACACVPDRRRRHTDAAVQVAGGDHWSQILHAMRHLVSPLSLCSSLSSLSLCVLVFSHCGRAHMWPSVADRVFLQRAAGRWLVLFSNS